MGSAVHVIATDSVHVIASDAVHVTVSQTRNLVPLL